MRFQRYYTPFTMTNDHSLLSRFIFENVPIRGEVTRIGDAWRTVLAHHNYPPPLQRLLGELIAASALLAATLKLEGSLIMQIQGNGPVSLLVVECTGDLKLRATAKWSNDFPDGSLAELIGDGRFVMTLDIKDGKQAYQGIVPLEGGSIAEVLQNYMMRSEQLETRLFLCADTQQVAGLLIQKLPEQISQDEDAWPRICQLASTIKPEELLQLPADGILHRLFHEEDIRLFKSQSVSFQCRCSRESVANMLRILGKAEIDEIITERGSVEIHCEFCNQRYEFDVVDAQLIFATEIAVPVNNTTH